MINWAEDNESLRQRGDLTMWVSEQAQSVWSAPRRTSRGGQRRYSDLAIETCLTLRTTYRLALRQTQGLMGSIGTLMGLDIRVPDYSTLSRRANGLSIAQAMRQAGSVAVHLVVDSTALPGILDQLDGPVTGFLADGAYDGASTRDLLRERYGETLDVVIPPPKNAVIHPQSARDPTVRDHHIAQIRSNGRMAWQAATGYNRRSRIETQDRPLEERDRPQAQIPQLLQANHGDPGRPESSEHNDRTRTARVRTHRLTLRLGKGQISSPPRSMQQRFVGSPATSASAKTPSPTSSNGIGQTLRVGFRPLPDSAPSLVHHGK